MLRHAPKIALGGLLALLLGAGLILAIMGGLLPSGEHHRLVRLGVVLFLGGQGLLVAGLAAWAARKVM
ncbi:MAG: hypothetical protein HYZ11_01515 [Candidatus Tectomicrobia bacterium]|uniref:Uncharacterized protein n=1 Tax=Tectimicrobiota bacterium TaxID=2528274 RepID=A0A932MM39_UNCTE|nr:hypothetical protein [Candidatus Tectomicrobia bacterium]